MDATNDSTMEAAPHDDTTREKDVDVDFDWADVDFESGSDDDDGEEHVTGQRERHGIIMGEEPSEEPSLTTVAQATCAAEEKVANETLHPGTFPKEARHQEDVEHLHGRQSLPPEEEQQETRKRRPMGGLEMSGGSRHSSSCIASTTVGKEASKPVFVFQQEPRPKAALGFQQEDHQVVKAMPMHQARIEHEPLPSKEDKPAEQNGPVANESSDLSTEPTALGLLFSPIS
jgi:hypothetical protein